MKLTVTAQISLDGVMQGPGAPVPGFLEGGGFDRDGWAHFDDDAAAAMDEIFRRADAFLFGRRTYEVFANSWGSWPDPGGSPIWTALHTKPKYVASTNLAAPEWADTHVIGGDLLAGVRELKARPERELQVHASAALFQQLMADGLVDEMTLFTFPVVVGQGKRLFPEAGDQHQLELTESRRSSTGIAIQTYRPAHLVA
ncbi:MAG TPA: dihydrofolate reductase family protein [Candidatus Limnocylindrales bacterium]|nr:dihydrofolate reductase family protein [Candidatus Limnocylindrales bacterium]